MNSKQNSKLYILIVVGFVSAFGPFVTDFYLPALPVISNFFETSVSMAQLTLTVSMVGLAIGQLFIGPLSDRYGRKNLLLFSLTFFIFSTIGCLCATPIWQFVFFRFIQGLSGAGGVVISKSIAADLYEGKQLAQFFSMLSCIQGLAPICAPVLGGLLLMVTDWRGIFCVLLIVGFMLAIAILWFKESSKGYNGNLKSAFIGFVPILKNRKFMQYVMVQVSAMGVMFTYISASPFIFQVHYGLSPVVYGLLFGVNALGIMIGSLLVIKVYTIEKGLLVGAKGLMIMSLVVGVTLILGLSIWFVEVAIFILLFYLGMILPTSTTLSLQLIKVNSGNASAVLGFLTFMIGGICSPLAGLGNILYSTSALMVLCAISSFLFTRTKSLI